MFRKIDLILILFLSAFLFPLPALSQNQGDISALAGLSGLKVYFDVKADSAAKVEKRFQWIHDTYEQASQKGLKVAIIVGIRSQASFFVTRGDDFIDEEDILIKGKIEKWLKRFVAMGIPMEQCGISAKLFDIEVEEFLPQIKVVKNSYLSIAGYQNKGYAYVPM
jgi:uncharacterized protein